jgi:parallel beta-helix repeat protein
MFYEIITRSVVKMDGDKMKRNLGIKQAVIFGVTIVLLTGAGIIPTVSSIPNRSLNTKNIDIVIINSPPYPPVNTSATIVNEYPRSVVLLSNVPTSTWTYGCSATAAGMIFGYYDRTDYPNMYTGPANGGVCPLTNLGQGIGTPIPGSCYIIATQQGHDGITTRGHVNDYWISPDSPGPDPWEGHWSQHTWALCTADFMGTNQWKWDYVAPSGRDSNLDGGTTFFYNTNGYKTYDYIPPSGYGLPQTEGGHGMKLFAESRGYTVDVVYNQYTDNYNPNGFTFSDYKAEIDAGRPVMIHLVGHSMVGMGYDDATRTIYLHDTWDNSVHTMTWGGSYAGMPLRGVTVIHLNEGVHYGWWCIKQETFEGAWPNNWVVENYGNYGGEAQWGKTNLGQGGYTSNNGCYCAMEGPDHINPPGPYRNNMDTRMVYGPFDLSDATDAYVRFYLWYDTQAGHDFVGCTAAINEMGTYYYSDTSRFSGRDRSWRDCQLDLTNVHTLGNLCAHDGQPGRSQVWIAFVFQSDGSTAYEGAYLDDILIMRYIPNEPPVAYLDSITPNPAIQGQTVTFSGYGVDPEEGPITGYNWRSSINGQLSTAQTFSTNTLSVGTHTIYFKVKDDQDQWSAEDTATLEVRASIPPVAYIDSITPNPAVQGQTVTFNGHGVDPDGGSITEYNWRSSRDGQLSTSRTFSTSTLSVGTHTIYFKVKDDEGDWSTEDTGTLLITPPHCIKNLDTDEEFTDIQTAVDHAQNGQTLFVYSSAYQLDDPVEIDRSITLMGENKETTFIDSTDDVGFYIYADGVTVTGFTFLGGSFWGGIDLCSENCVISGNKFTNNDAGINIEQSSYSITQENEICDNEFIENDVGIDITVSNSDSGVANSIHDNDFIRNDEGITRWNLGGASDNKIMRNRFIENTQHGIYLAGVTEHEVCDNDFVNNRVGIELSHNGGGMYPACYSYDNRFYNNRFIGSTYEHALDYAGDFTNYWDDGVSQGNYWDDYVPPGTYPIPGTAGHEDRYPSDIRFVGPEQDYASIGAALAGASDGDTIYVYPDTYEENVVITSSITLIGHDPSDTIIDALGHGSTITITADHVTVRGFTITGAGSNLYHYDAGIFIDDPLHHPLYGLADSCYIADNIITNYYWYGIVLKDSSYNTITRNAIRNTLYGTGIYVRGAYPYVNSENNEISYNIIENNYLSGIVLGDAWNNIIFENTIENNREGICTNQYTGGSDGCYGNLIYHNNFKGASQEHVFARGQDSWDNGATEGGNYWEGHLCDGDPSNTPYLFPPDQSNQDNYPYEHENGWL